MIATKIDSIKMPVKAVIDGDERETLLDPLVKRIDKMGRVYIDRDLAERAVLITVFPIKQGDKEKWMKIGRDD